MCFFSKILRYTQDPGNVKVMRWGFMIENEKVKKKENTLATKENKGNKENKNLTKKKKENKNLEKEEKKVTKISTKKKTSFKILLFFLL